MIELLLAVVVTYVFGLVSIDLLNRLRQHLFDVKIRRTIIDKLKDQSVDEVLRLISMGGIKK